MFQVHEYVMHDTRGVCRVEEVVHPDFAGKGKLYYKLTPVFEKKTVLYVPVLGGPSGKLSVRPLISKEEALALIEQMPGIEAKTYGNFKEQAQVFREILYSGDQKERIALMKGIFENDQKRRGSGKRLSANEEESRRTAEAFLYGELAVVLDIPINQVEDYIGQRLEGREEQG